MPNEEGTCTYATARRNRQKKAQRKTLQARVLECEAIIDSLIREIYELRREKSRQQRVIDSLVADKNQMKRVIDSLVADKSQMKRVIDSLVTELQRQFKTKNNS